MYWMFRIIIHSSCSSPSTTTSLSGKIKQRHYEVGNCYNYNRFNGNSEDMYILHVRCLTGKRIGRRLLLLLAALAGHYVEHSSCQSGMGFWIGSE